MKWVRVRGRGTALDCDLVFSSLPGDIAREAEGSFARAGYPVISNSSAYRMDEDVPLLIPEVNHQHLGLLERQRAQNSSGGYIVTNPNCSTIMLAVALAPLHIAFGVESVVATTMQALSGAGYPGVASLDSLNLLFFTADERNHIIENVEPGHSWITCARKCLDLGCNHPLNPKHD